MGRYVRYEDVGKMALSMMGITNSEWAQALQGLPTIDIVWCSECKFENTRKCPPHRMGLIHDESDYCSYGIRKTDGVDKHDEAVEALGHLIKHMKGADDEHL